MEVVYRIIGGSIKQEFYCTILNTIFVEVKYDHLRGEVKIMYSSLMLVNLKMTTYIPKLSSSQFYGLEMCMVLT